MMAALKAGCSTTASSRARQGGSAAGSQAWARATACSRARVSEASREGRRPSASSRSSSSLMLCVITPSIRFSMMNDPNMIITTKISAEAGPFTASMHW